MEPNQPNIVTLITKIFSGEHTPEEVALVEAWRQATPENQTAYEQLHRIWQDTGRIPPFPQRTYNTAAAWAKIDPAAGQIASIFPMQENGDGLEVKGRLRRLMSIAAAVLVVIAGATTWWYTHRQDQGLQHVVANQGGNKTVELGDHSKITLREGASISFNKNLQNGERIVHLKGQAYFEVAGDPAHPFRVRTANQSEVEVLGTSFTVASNDSATTVIVASGRVKLTHALDSSIILETGQQGIARETQLYARRNDNINFMAWKTGVLQFNDATLVEILPQLADFYGKVIRIDPAYRETAATQKATASFSSQSCEEVLHELQLLLGFNYRETGDTIVISR